MSPGARTNFGLCPPVLGTLVDGTPCDDDSQCKGGFCGESADGGTCGACTEIPGATSCEENSNCPSGQLCNADGTCIAPGAAGATCDSNDPYQANQPCAPSLYCKGATQTADGGTVNGACAPLATAGQPCDSTDPNFECADGLTCSSNQCVKIQFVAVSGACDGVLLVCAAGECVSANADASSGACQAYAANGGSCGSSADCEFNAGCTNGACTTSSPSCN